MLLRVVFTMTILFFLPILLIRAQPYQEMPLDRFFAEYANCPAPCLLGVHLGETHWQAAMSILETQDFVGEVQLRPWHNGYSLVWNWAGEPQDIKNFGFILDNEQPTWPMIPATIPLGEVLLALGEPDQVTVIANGKYPPRVAYVLEYPSRALYVFSGFHACYTDRARLWRLLPNGDLSGNYFVGVGTAEHIRRVIPPAIRLDREAWAKQLGDLCRP